MLPNWANDEDAFNHFLSAFPSSWLAVPFTDPLRRDLVCTSLSLLHDPQCLLVDRHHMVVLHQPFGHHGSSCPPFCDRCINGFWWQHHTQLHSILDAEFVFKINNVKENSNNNNNNKVSVCELEDKLVGLYLCFDGTLIRTLDLVSQECKARNQEFHIVMVYLPYKQSVDPLLFQTAINHVLHRLHIPASNPHCWVSPFNDFVSRKLWRAGVFPCAEEEDQLVILDPNLGVADYLGKYVINRFGINGYPFTRHFLLLRELEAIRALTLEALLAYGSRDYLLRTTNDEQVPVPIDELRGKNVLVYFDQVETPSENYHTLLEWYNQNKTKSSSVADFEVVFVHFDGECQCGDSCAKTSAYFTSSKPKPMAMPMPWLVCPFDPQHTVYVKERINKAGTHKGMLAAFDKHGRIITLYAEDLLHLFGPEGFPSYDGLHNEILHHISLQYELYIENLFDHGPIRTYLLGGDTSKYFLLS